MDCGIVEKWKTMDLQIVVQESMQLENRTAQQSSSEASQSPRLQLE